MTSVLPVRLVLFRAFLRKSDKIGNKGEKHHFYYRDNAGKIKIQYSNSARGDILDISKLSELTVELNVLKLPLGSSHNSIN